MTTAVSIDNISKRYRLGVISNRTLYQDLNSWWARIRGKPDPMLKLEDIDHGNRENGIIWALREVNFEIPQGQVLGIIGRNGAGKSTLLKILSRVTAPTKGYVKTRGRVASLLEVGTGFHPELTGRENVYLNGAILGMSRSEIERKFDEIVAFSEVEKFVDTPVKRYSSGMHVRLAFSVAAHLDPEIMVVDEVLAVGDANFQRKCIGKMSDSANEGRTVLFVSHNMAAINRLCSRVILLNKGSLEADGNSPEITALYLAGSSEEGGSRVWDINNAPGEDGFKLTGVHILDSHGKPLSVTDVKEELNIRLEYHTSKPNMKFRCMVIFYTQGVLAFASNEPVEEIRSIPGQYYSIVTVPSNLLTEGEYTIGISVFGSAAGKKRYVQVKSAVLFHVYDPLTGNSARGDYAQALAGVVRPIMRWENGEIG